MIPPSRYPLTEAEMALLLDRQATVIEWQAARIKELEATLSKPKKTSSNSSQPPSQDGPGKPNRRPEKKRRKRPPRPGVGRLLAPAPDQTERHYAAVCPHCAAVLPAERQHCRQRYDHVEIPPIRPEVTRVELFGCRCGACGRRCRAEAPADKPLGTPFGPNIQALLFYLHHSHHVSFERLSRLMRELYGLAISEGAITNAFARVRLELEKACAAIKAKLLTARVIASDETTTRVDGVTQWQWVFLSDEAVLHEIAPRRAKSVAETVLGEFRPEIWVSDRYAGQQDLAGKHQVCLAHVLRDVQYAIDCGDQWFAPKIRDLLRWTIGVGKRRDALADSTLAQYAAKADRTLDALLRTPAVHPAGFVLQKQIKAWRGKFFLFLADRQVPATNNDCEREIRPSVVFRKVTNGFRSDWGAAVHAGYRSVTGTARISGISAFNATKTLIAGRFAIP
jgi:transposase